MISISRTSVYKLLDSEGSGLKVTTVTGEEECQVDVLFERNVRASINVSRART